MLFSQVKNPFPNYGSLELPEQLSDRVIFFAEFLPRPLYAVAPRFSPQMSNKIAFDTDSPEPTRTRADFAYKTTSPVISIVDTGLGKCSVTEDIEAVLRKTEYWHQGAISPSRSCARTAKDFGTEFTGTAEKHPLLLWARPTSEKPANNLPGPSTERIQLAAERGTFFMLQSGQKCTSNCVQGRPAEELLDPVTQRAYCRWKLVPTLRLATGQIVIAGVRCCGSSPILLAVFAAFEF